MKINDKVYGEEEINEPVLIELINSKPVQRLKGISQFGLPQRYYHKNTFSRYEHSIGVLILLRKLGAEIDEQIAGLLHDVSHTAFSHVVDWVVGDPTKEDYQDKIHLEVIEISEIPNILKNYGLDYKLFSKVEDFSLLEKEIPLLCADRIDYSLREICADKGVEFVRVIFANLINQNGTLIFTDKNIAEIFAKEFLRLQKEHWAGEEARARYYILSNIIKEAIRINLLSFSDLSKTDEYVLEILNESDNTLIIQGLNLLKGGFKIEESEDGVELLKKFRYVNPYILIENNVVFLSEISPEFSQIIEDEKQRSNFTKKIIINEL